MFHLQKKLCIGKCTLDRIRMVSGFHGREHAALYKKFRPGPDAKLINRILNFVRKQTGTSSGKLSIAVDVACGSGQGTQVLAPHCQRVIGVDVSEAQITEARKTNTARNVEYRIGTAENLPIENNSTDLLTCSQAAHWLNFPNFCREADRVLMPTGCIAVYTRDVHRIKHQKEDVAKKLTDLFDEIYFGTLEKYWTHGIDYEDIYMQELNIPYKNFERHKLDIENTLTVATLAGFIASTSAYQNYHRDNPNHEDILGLFQKRFLELLQVMASSENTVIQTVTPTYLLLASKPRCSS